MLERRHNHRRKRLQMRKSSYKRYLYRSSLVFILLVSFLAQPSVVEHQAVNNRETFDTPVSAEHSKAGIKSPVIKRQLATSSALSDYQTVWENDLFNSAVKTPPLPVKRSSASAVENTHTIDLKIVRTVIGGSSYRMAVIEKDRGQRIYHEGDAIDRYIVKQILRDNVIVTSQGGGKYLMLVLNCAGRSESGSAATVQASSATLVPRSAFRPNMSGGRFRVVELSLAEIKQGFSDIDHLLQEVGTHTYRFGKLTGFVIDNEPDESILKKIGLKSHDAIMALNSQPLENELEAFSFFKQIAAGKKTIIQFRRRNRTRQIELNPI